MTLHSCTVPGGCRRSCVNAPTVHALEVEEASQTALGSSDDTCCKPLWLWHRHAGKIDWIFRIVMPPSVGVFWLQMMFLAGYTYSYEYLAAYLVVFILVCVLLGWNHIQHALIFCCGWCLPFLDVCCNCVSCCTQCCSCKRRV